YQDLSIRNDPTTEQLWWSELFTKYAGKSGNKETLSKRELGEIKAEIKEFFDSLDEDGDGEVDFKEFVNFAVTLNMLCCCSDAALLCLLLRFVFFFRSDQAAC
uniref:EF-hand domain-containing protein n=1 Tax=Acanthochromis polyacanthus TaxID=80966 RepID=A0A3Q1GV96_9TELE